MKSKIGRVTIITMLLAVIILLSLNLVTPFVRAVPVGAAVEYLGSFTGPRNAYNIDDNVKSSLDALHYKILLEQIGASQTGSLPNGAVYYVDGATGDDTDDGLSPTNAVDTIAQAITLSNAEYALTGNAAKMNVIFVAGGTYTEDLETFPANCHVVGVGSFTRIQNLGTHTCAGVDNCHFWNISFRGGTAGAAMISIANSSHSLGFHNCIFDSQATISSCLYYAGSSSNQIIENCEFGYETNAVNSPDIVLNFAGVHCQRMKIINNRLWTTGVGIQIESTMSSNGYMLIKGNFIANSSARDNQATFGYRDLTANAMAAYLVNNYISAADAIYFSVAGTKSANLCINNYIVQAGTGDTETDMSD